MGLDDINIELDATETRLTAHLFDASYPCLLPTGPVVHVPNALSQGFLDGWEMKFYPGVLTITALADDQRRHNQAAVEKDNAKQQVDERRVRHERRDKQHDEQGGGSRRMAIFDLFLNYKYIGIEPEVAARYEEELQEANTARDREKFKVKVSSWRQEIPADTSVVILSCTSTRLPVCVPSLPFHPSRSAYVVILVILLLLSTTALSMLVLGCRRCCSCSPSSLHACHSFHLIYYLITIFNSSNCVWVTHNMNSRSTDLLLADILHRLHTLSCRFAVQTTLSFSLPSLPFFPLTQPHPLALHRFQTAQQVP